MNILKYFLVLAVIVYGVRLILKWLFSGVRPRKSGTGQGREKGNTDYSDLTDQKIEDADYEEL